MDLFRRFGGFWSIWRPCEAHREILTRLRSDIVQRQQQVAPGHQKESIGSPQHCNIANTTPDDFPDDMRGSGGV